MFLRRGAMVTGFLALSVVLGACGGDDGKPLSAGTQGATTTAPPAATTTAGGSATTAAGVTTTTPPVTGTRSPVPTTVSPGVAATNVDQSFVPESTASYTFRPLAMNGVTYPNALRIFSERSPVKVEVNAGRNRKRFQGSLSIPDDQKSSAQHLVEISLDNAPPTYSVLVSFGETKEIDIDVTNVLRVRITVSAKADSGYLAIGNPRFTN